MRRPTVLSLPLRLVFPGLPIKYLRIIYENGGKSAINRAQDGIPIPVKS
jgi:hypothetical protein